MKLNWKLCNCWSLKNHHHLLIRVAVAILLMGFAFRLFFFKSEEFLQTPVVDKTEVAEATPPVVATVDVSEYEDQNQMPQKGNKCVFFELGFASFIACIVAMNKLVFSVVSEAEDQNEMPQKGTKSIKFGLF